MQTYNFSNDQQIRWCPGCGDYAILKYLQQALEKKGLKPDEVVVISGIGCASRLPYYLSCYGFHTIHGRAPCIATGIALANPNLPVIIITGDGDGLSIGLHHLMHMLRRNVNVTVLLLNNRVYGLTKGQASPTSQLGQITKTSLDGHQEQPLEGLAVALASGATMIGRCLDTQGILMQRLISASLDHEGTSLIEIYQNCPIFNDQAFASLGRQVIDNPMLCSVWPGESISYDTNKTLVLHEGEWIIKENELETIYQGKKNHAQLLLELKKPVIVGLFYQEKTRSFFKVNRSNLDLKGSFERACHRLLTWEIDANKD